MTDLQRDTALGALVDTLAAVEADPKPVKFLTVEVELKNGVPIGARSWIERGCTIGRLLGDRGGSVRLPVPAVHPARGQGPRRGAVDRRGEWDG